MSDMKYTEDHEYVRVEGDVATVGITIYAQEQLGDIVYVELPEKGKSLAKGDEAAVIESVKAAAEVYAPITGEVVEANAALDDSPALVNESPESDAWIMKIKIADTSELDGMMDAAGYKEFVAGLD